jgi:tetratricopeptide (TPR) repeat protein
MIIAMLLAAAPAWSGPPAAAPAWSGPPADASAWSGPPADGRALMALDRFAEAVESFTQAGDHSPAHAAALIRLGRLDDARALVAGDLTQAAEAFALAGEIGRARALLEAGLADHPDDAALLLRLGSLELAAGRTLRAVAPLARAAELAPLDPPTRLAEVRALMAAGMPVRAAQAAEQARKAGLVEVPLLIAELTARQAYGDHRAAIAAAEAHGIVVDSNAALSRLLAVSLDSIGARARAAERRRIADTLAPAMPAGPEALPLGEQARGRALDLLEAERWGEAAPAVLDWARLRPDDGAAAQALLKPEIAARIGWAAAFRHLADLVARDPEDPGRHLLACDLHAEPPGNELLVLAHAHALDRLAETDDARVARGRARREQALERLARLGRILDLDAAAGRVVIERPSGDVLDVTVDPATGRLRRIVQGPRWIEAIWRDNGVDLAEIKQSSGARLLLTWRNGRLVGLMLDAKAGFRAELSDDGGLAHIEPARAVPAYNDAVALIAAWPQTDIGGAMWLRLGQ